MTLDPASLRVLLVEDAATMRKIERRTLASLGFDKVTEAVARLQEEGPYDLVISDRNMPSKGGDDLLLWVRANEATRRIPFIMATGQGDSKQERKALEGGGKLLLDMDRVVGRDMPGTSPRIRPPRPRA